MNNIDIDEFKNAIDIASIDYTDCYKKERSKYLALSSYMIMHNINPDDVYEIDRNINIRKACKLYVLRNIALMEMIQILENELKSTIDKGIKITYKES